MRIRIRITGFHVKQMYTHLEDRKVTLSINRIKNTIGTYGPWQEDVEAPHSIFLTEAQVERLAKLTAEAGEPVILIQENNATIAYPLSSPNATEILQSHENPRSSLSVVSGSEVELRGSIVRPRRKSGIADLGSYDVTYNAKSGGSMCLHHKHGAYDIAMTELNSPAKLNYRVPHLGGKTWFTGWMARELVELTYRHFGWELYAETAEA